MKPKVYIETTIVSYLTAKPSRDIVRLSHQLVTQKWWRTRRSAYDTFTSQIVIDEASRGDPAAAARRLRALEPITRLELPDTTLALAASFETTLRLPTQARPEAVHLAVAALNAMNFLLTWNCTHLANAHLAGKIEEVCRAFGVDAPYVITPEQLMEKP